MKYNVPADIVVDAENSIDARNQVLKFLAAAELSGKIYHFGVGEATKK